MNQSPLSLRLLAPSAKVAAKYKIWMVCVAALAVAVVSLLRFISLTSRVYAVEQYDAIQEERYRLMRTEMKPKDMDKITSKLSASDPAYEMNALRAPEYHLVISTGCTTYQDWQSFAMFYHAQKSGQVRQEHEEGLTYVTRVVSGCNEGQKQKMNEIHEKIIAPIAPGRFFIHHTPSYRFVKPNVDYVYFNKAFGYQHWLVNALRYPYNQEKYDNVTYILLDPDQILLRPFKDDFTNENEIWGGPFQDKRIVQRWQPFAQEYAMGVGWLLNVDIARIAPKNEVLNSRLKNMSKIDSYAFQVGPPYIMKGYDLWRLVNKWVDFNPYVYDQLPAHISEMYAYSIAAAHLNLPHAVAHTFMVSNTMIVSGEGWPLIDDKSDEDVCLNVPQQDLPHVLHFCQHYGLGKYFFSKYKLPTNFISCEAPLLREPPRNIATLYNYQLRPNGERTESPNNKWIRRNAFALCYMVKAMNDAAEYFKQRHCPTGQANFNKTLIFHDSIDDR